jgi:hypothetical protein
LKSVRAYERGYYGRVMWTESGEWIPSSVRAFASMWHRWIYGSLQVLAVHWSKMLTSPGYTFAERVEVFRHVKFGLYFLPYFAVAAGVIHPHAAYLPYLVSYALMHAACTMISAGMDAPGARGGLRPFFATFLTSIFVSWIGFRASAAFFGRACTSWWRRAGKDEGRSWTVTAKGIEARWGWHRRFQEHAVGYVCNGCMVVLSICLFWLESHDQTSLFIRAYGAVYFLGIFLYPALYGDLGRTAADAVDDASIDAWVRQHRPRQRVYMEGVHES